MNNHNVRYAVVFIIGLVAGVGGYWLWDNRSVQPVTSNSLTLDTQEVASTTPEAHTGGVNTLMVADQPAGRTIKITQVHLEKQGWVAIHDDVNGQPGPKILGAKEFTAGTTNNGSFNLLRAMESGKNYIAVLRSDDGNLVDFNTKTDTPLQDAAGNLIMVKFTAQ